MQRRVRPWFKQRGMSLCFYSYLPLFRFRLSRWIFLLPANLHLLAGRWPFRMTVWVWHEPRKMNRGEPRPPSVPGPSAARGTCTLGGLKMQKGKLVKYEKESHYENIADNSDSWLKTKQTQNLCKNPERHECQKWNVMFSTAELMIPSLTATWQWDPWISQPSCFPLLNYAGNITQQPIQTSIAI